MNRSERIIARLDEAVAKKKSKKKTTAKKKSTKRRSRSKKGIDQGKVRATIADLLLGTEKFIKKNPVQQDYNSDRIEDSHTVKIFQADVNLAVGVKTLTLRTVSKTPASKGKRWKQTLMITGLDIARERDKEHPVPIESRGKTYWLPKLDVTKTEVLLDCSCPDFQFTGEWWVHNKLKSLYGSRPKPYTRKTKTYPRRNEKEIPMLCKHLVSTIQLLKEMGLLKGYSLP